MSLESRKKEKKEKRIASARKLADASAGRTSKAFRIPEGVQVWEPEVGERTIDIIGYESKEGNPASEGKAGYLVPARLYHVHRGVGPNKEVYTCPGGTFGKPCPICRYRDKVISEEGWQSDLAKQLRPSARHLWNVFDPKQPEKGVQLWDVSEFCFGRAVKAALERKPDHDDYHDPDAGKSLEATFEKETFGGNDFIKSPHVKVVKREHTLPDGLVPICCDDLIVETEFERLKSIFEAGTTGEEEEKVSTAVAPKKAESSTKEYGKNNTKEETKKPALAKTPAVDDDDDDFDDEDEDEDYEDDEWEDDEDED